MTPLTVKALHIYARNARCQPAICCHIVSFNAWLALNVTNIKNIATQQLTNKKMHVECF